MKKLLLLLFVCPLLIFAQAPHGQGGPGGPGGNMPEIGVVRGKVIDSQTKNPIEYATIALIRQKDSAIANGTTSNASGSFEMKELKFGRYKVRVGFVGYKNKIIDSIFIYPKQTIVDLGTIELDLASKQLSEVQVVASNDMIISGIDKKVYNVEKNIVSAGGSATDVLQNIPSVNVDIDGNVTMRGSGNLTILIDGKPSGMVAASKSQALEQIPASSIQSIEIITNPSAKYDPEGMSGIINIILKKNIKQGLNGIIQGSAGTGDKYNTSLSLGYRNSLVNLTGSYSYLNNQSKGMNDSKRYNTLSDTLSWYQQKGKSFGHRSSHVGKIGADFYLNPKNTLGATAVVSLMDGSPRGYTKYYTFDNKIDNNPISLSNRADAEKSASYSMDYALNYKKTFKKPDQTLTADVQYTIDDEDEDNYFDTRYLDPNTENDLGFPVTKEIDYGTDIEKTLNVQADYTHPLKKQDSKIETGYRSVFRTLDNDLSITNFNPLTSEWAVNNNISNHFVYNTQVHALYGTYSNTIKKLSFQGGLRLEQALSEFVMTKTSESFSKDYFSFFPTIHFSFKETEDRQWQLSYTRRVNRPGSESLNPFHHITDPMNVRAGNPKIDPEYIDSYEASYLHMWKKYTLTSSLFYKKVNNMISRYKISFNDSAMLQYAPSLFDIKNDSATLTTFINYSNSQSYGFEFIAMANPIKILKGKGSIGFRVSDILNTRKMHFEMFSTTFSQEGERRRDMRTFYINFSYKFGKMDKSDRRPKNQDDREGPSMDDGM